MPVAATTILPWWWAIIVFGGFAAIMLGLGIWIGKDTSNGDE